MSFYSVAKAMFSGLVRFLWRVELENAENEPEGAFLICSNHISAVDPVILAACLRHDPKFMAKKELMNIPLVSGLLKVLGAYPIDRGGNDVGAIRKTINYLKEGQSVIMFPQGTRCAGRDPKETKVKSGCSMIAQHAGVPVLPILIKTEGYRSRLFRKTLVRIGKPISVAELAETQGSMGDYASGAKLIFSRILDEDGE